MVKLWWYGNGSGDSGMTMVVMVWYDDGSGGMTIELAVVLV